MTERCQAQTVHVLVDLYTAWKEELMQDVKDRNDLIQLLLWRHHTGCAEDGWEGHGLKQELHTVKVT